MKIPWWRIGQFARKTWCYLMGHNWDNLQLGFLVLPPICNRCGVYKSATEFYLVEYDPNYAGGDYNSTGTFVLVNAYEVSKLGMNEAFTKKTGHPAHCIVHYSNEMYSESGELL